MMDGCIWDTSGTFLLCILMYRLSWYHLRVRKGQKRIFHKVETQALTETWGQAIVLERVPDTICQARYIWIWIPQNDRVGQIGMWRSTLWCHQTWLAGKSPMNGGFIGKIIDTWSIFQHAMFDYQTVPTLGAVKLDPWPWMTSSSAPMAQVISVDGGLYAQGFRGPCVPDPKL